MFGIRDAKARERLLRETKLTLTKTDEISRASESMLAQMKIVGDNSGATVYKKPQKRSERNTGGPGSGRSYVITQDYKEMYGRF